MHYTLRTIEDNVIYRVKCANYKHKIPYDTTVLDSKGLRVRERAVQSLSFASLSSEEMNASSELKTHDVFNLVVLTIFVTIDLVYLVLATDFSQLGTDSIGENYRSISDVLLIGFTLYLVIDILWVLYIPTCVASNPSSIITHHIACLVLISVPWTLPQFSWHLAVNLLVEINTLFLTARRNVSSNSFSFKMFDSLFYLTWVMLRLVLFPILVVFFYYEFERYSISVQSHIHILLLAPILECFVTAMSFKWTYDMLAKLLVQGPKKT